MTPPPTSLKRDFGEILSDDPKNTLWRSESILKGLFNTVLRSTFGSVVQEIFKPPLTTKTNWWKFGQIWSLRRPQRNQINATGKMINDKHVIRWTMTNICMHDNDARGRHRLQCSRARCLSMVERWETHTSHYQNNLTRSGNVNTKLIPAVPSILLTLHPLLRLYIWPTTDCPVQRYGRCVFFDTLWTWKPLEACDAILNPSAVGVIVP